MRNFLLILVTGLAPLTSYAVVADKFTCSIELKDFATKLSTKQDKDFFIARLPLAASPSPDVRMTAGKAFDNLTFNVGKGEYNATVNFFYKHALRMDEHGVPVEARQLTCVAPYGTYCDKSEGEGPFLCNSAALMCMDSDKPFDPEKGWSPTPLSGDTPAFNDKAIAATSQNIKDENGHTVGQLNVDCRFKGTFQ